MHDLFIIYRSCQGPRNINCDLVHHEIGIGKDRTNVQRFCSILWKRLEVSHGGHLKKLQCRKVVGRLSEGSVGRNWKSRRFWDNECSRLFVHRHIYTVIYTYIHIAQILEFTCAYIHVCMHMSMCACAHTNISPRKEIAKNI